MPEQTTDPDVRADEVARLREENLRFRDLLIAKDAEIGLLKGQVEALEAGTARLLNLVGRIRSLVPGFAWGILMRLRRRGRQG
jgi:hypothetical protein